MHKREAAFQSAFGRWLQYKYSGGTAVFELKRTLTDSLPLKEIRDVQLSSLLKASERGLYHKIADDSRGPKPFDCMFISKTPAYVVIAFGKTLKDFYMIHIADILEISARGEKSITKDDAAVIGLHGSLEAEKPKKKTIYQTLHLGGLR